MSTKKKNVIIDLIEDIVVTTRIFEHIEKVTTCTDHGLNSWYPITYLMGIDINEGGEESDTITDQYRTVFSNYLEKEIDNKDTAVLIYNQFDKMVADHLKEYPYLKAS